jgi:aspartyl-tRNA(Asn)/glutamyl-tRNA(Gln) amidotransferase subunit B
LAELVDLIESGRISGKQAKQVYATIRGTDLHPTEIVAQQGVQVLRDQAALGKLGAEIVAAFPQERAKYRAGKTGLLGFFVAKLIQATSGAADPGLASEVLASLLGDDARRTAKRG